MDEETPPSAGAPAWMATFGDLMSLLLCFFVLLLSFSEMNIVKFRAMAGSMRDAFGVSARTRGLEEQSSSDLIELSDAMQHAPSVSPEAEQRARQQAADDARRAEEKQLDQELLDIVDQVISERGLDDRVQAVMGDRGVTIRADSQLMFEPGNDAMRAEAGGIMEEIAELAALFPYKIVVGGHTDDAPIRTARFPSNWELSSARAVAGVRFLIDVGAVEPARVSAQGFADTQPLVANDTPEGRAKNRRIEFVFYRVNG
jgi:chemotaxis protein MotB